MEETLSNATEEVLVFDHQCLKMLTPGVQNVA
jgi:hypothetical protein